MLLYCFCCCYHGVGGNYESANIICISGTWLYNLSVSFGKENPIKRQRYYGYLFDPHSFLFSNIFWMYVFSFIRITYLNIQIARCLEEYNFVTCYLSHITIITTWFLICHCVNVFWVLYVESGLPIRTGCVRFLFRWTQRTASRASSGFFLLYLFLFHHLLNFLVHFLMFKILLYYNIDVAASREREIRPETRWQKQRPER